MKLAQIVAQSPLPSGSNTRYATPPPSSGIGEGLQGLAEVGNQVAAHMAKADAELKKYEQAFEATASVTTARDQLDQGEAVLKMGARDPATDELITPAVEPQEFMPAWLKLRDKVSEEALGRAKDPTSKLVVGRMLETMLGERQTHARAYEYAARTARIETRLDQDLADYGKQAVLEPDATTPSGAPLWESLAQRSLAAATGAVPEAKLRAKQAAFVEHLDTALANRRFLVAPDQAIEDLQTGKYRLDQGKANALAATLETKWAARQAREDATARRDDAAMVQSIKENHDATIGALSRDASNGKLSLEQLDDWAAMLNMHDEPYQRLRKIVTEAPKDAPSDPSVYQRLSIAINTGDRSVTRERLAAFRAPGGGLNQKDYEHLDGKLKGEIDSRKGDVERAEGKALAAEGRALTAQHYDYSQTIAYAQQQLGIPDKFPLDKTREKLWADFTDDLFLRAHPTRGPKAESARAVAEELIPRYRVRMGELAQRDISEIEPRLRWKTKDELEAGALKYRLPADQVRQQMDLLAELAARKKTLADLEQKRATEKGAGGVKRTPAKPE